MRKYKCAVKCVVVNKLRNIYIRFLKVYSGYIEDF